MELFEAKNNYIIIDGYHSLWCNRVNGGIVARQGVTPSEAFDPVCKGKVYGVIGKIQLFPGSEWKLLVITKRTLLGLFPGNHEVYRIDRIAVLPLSEGDVIDLELDPCEKHQTGGRPKGGGDGQQKGLERTWISVKIAVNSIKENVKNNNVPKDIKEREKEKLEKRLLEEIYKMFNDSDSFIYSPSGDITNMQQKQCGEHYDSSLPLWKRVDERFFWNKYMLKDLIESEVVEEPMCSRWILPVVQGYCQIAHCVNKFEEDEPDDSIEKNRGILPEEEFDLILISRRSVHRAGTRYKRRGVDEDGEVANFVETEQIVRTEIHAVSFVQVRGSVPIYWSQPGYKYRPPPCLDKSEEDTLLAFMSHFAHQLKYYGGVVIINLIDQVGREKIIGDAFMDNILTFNNPLLTYVTYDFHDYCRGMKFENVAILLEGIMDLIKDMRYCWTDSKGIICEQTSVFRVNCMDCLDRTNVVQAALARHVMEVQLRKLGKLLPDQNLPSDIKKSFQEMWANNGDAISRQYAGTAAMKGDFTRTGQRGFHGVVKDGYNSANRYYLNRFKAVYRQTVIDAMLGNPLTEDLTLAMATLKNGDEEPWTMEREECVKELVMHCRDLILGDAQECLGGWALVDPFYITDGEPSPDQDVILLLTSDAYYVASYDDEEEIITQYECIAVEDVDKIEIGFEPTFKTRYLFMRIHYKHNGNGGYFHTLRTVQHRTPEEARGVLLGIADAFVTARKSKSLGIRINECNKLDKKRSKAPPEVIPVPSKSRLTSLSKLKDTKNQSFSDDEDDDTTITRVKKKRGGLQPFFRDHLTGMPRPYSDPCLARQDVAEYKPKCKKSGHSAPVSGESCSSSDDEAIEEGRLSLRLDKEKPLKTATKLESRSEDVLTRSENEQEQQQVNQNGEDHHEVARGALSDQNGSNSDKTEIHGNTSIHVAELETANDKMQSNTEKSESKEEQGIANTPNLYNLQDNETSLVESKEEYNENVAKFVENEKPGQPDSGNAEHSSETSLVSNKNENQELELESGNVPCAGKDAAIKTVNILEENSTEQECNQINNTELSDEECSSRNLGKQIGDTENLINDENNDLDVEQSSNAEDKTSIEKVKVDSERSDVEHGSNEDQDETETLDVGNDVSKSESEAGSPPENALKLEDIERIRVSYHESKQKLKDENADLKNIEEGQESSQDDLKPDVGPSPLVRLGLGGGLRSMTVSFKSSSNIDQKSEQLKSSESSLSEQETNKRYSTSLLGNRSPSTSRSGKGNIFASAQARSKNIIPDLRNKLSNISFNRTKSPRLVPKQQHENTTSSNDEVTLEQHKKHKRKHKCLTRIIEI